MKFGVTSSSFSKNDILKQELSQLSSNIEYNETGNLLDSDAVIQLLQDADCAIVGLENIDDGILKHCPKLKMISKYFQKIHT